MSLIKQCVCGYRGSNFSREEVNGITCDVCPRCDVFHQHLDMDRQQYYDFYSKDYHTGFQVNRGTQTYDQRYEHDCKIANMRLDYYAKYITDVGPLLDIGSSNNAFVDEAIKRGYKTNGVEIGEEGANHPDTTFHDDLLNLNLPSDEYQIVTLHDVFEHLVEPTLYLTELHRIMKLDGVLIIDYPHFWVPEGYHHWKPVEHLWFQTLEQLTGLLTQYGFETIEVTYPIPSKFVVYCKKV